MAVFLHPGRLEDARLQVTLPCRPHKKTVLGLPRTSFRNLRTTSLRRCTQRPRSCRGYSTSKFAVRGITEGLDLEWSKLGIRVSDIWPTFVKTAMADGFGPISAAKSLGIRLSPADVTATIWTCATSKRRIHKTHWTVGLQAGFLSIATRLGPPALTRWVVQYLAR